MGRYSIPDHVKQLTNDKAHQHRYADKLTLVPSSNRPIAPSHLSERGKVIFEEFVVRVEQMYSVSDTDVAAICRYASRQEQLECYEYILRTQGSTTEVVDKFGGVSYKPRPEVAMLNKCETVLASIENLFGLNPNSRARLHIKKTDTKKINPFAALDNKE